MPAVMVGDLVKAAAGPRRPRRFQIDVEIAFAIGADGRVVERVGEEEDEESRQRRKDRRAEALAPARRNERTKFAIRGNIA